MKRSLYLWLSLCLMALSGCSVISINSVENAEKSARMRMLADARVDTDPHLADRVGVVRLNSAVNQGGFMRIQAEVENFTYAPLSVNLHIDWYDGDAMRVDVAGDAWLEIPFEARESRSLVFVAPNRSARDFRIKLLAVSK